MRTATIIAATVWAVVAVGVIVWLNRAARKATTDESRTVRVVAPIDLRFPETTIEVAHTYTGIPTIRDMAATFYRISMDHGFTLEAAQAACESLYDLARLDTEAFDVELAVLS